MGRPLKRFLMFRHPVAYPRRWLLQANRLM